VRKSTRADPKQKNALEALELLKADLDSGIPANESSHLDPSLTHDLHLLTEKPVIFVFNVNETTLTDEEEKAKLRSLAGSHAALFVCAKLEDELKGLAPSDALELLESYDVHEPGLTQLIHAAYDTLGLQSYLTAGQKEVRAWTIHKGWTAPQAAGVIHTDFERGFIAAQVVDYDDLVAFGSETAARAAGKIAADYVMQANDIVEFRFNVSK